MNIPEGPERLARDRELYKLWLEDDSACAFVEGWMHLVHVWDDLRDGDPVDQAEVSRAFFNALTGWGENAFFAHYQAQLMPVIISAVHSWYASNLLQEGSEHEKAIAWVRRCDVINVIVHCAYLLKGSEHAGLVAVEVNRIAQSESFAQWCLSLEKTNA